MRDGRPGAGVDRKRADSIIARASVSRRIGLACPCRRRSRRRRRRLARCGCAPSGGVAALTQRGYDEDLGAFLRFLAGHRGGQVALGDLAGAAPCRFPRLARLAPSARATPAPRPPARWRPCAASSAIVDRRHGVHNPALQAMRTPRLPHRVPRPLAEADARDLIVSARTEARAALAGPARHRAPAAALRRRPAHRRGAGAEPRATSASTRAPCAACGCAARATRSGWCRSCRSSPRRWPPISRPARSRPCPTSPCSRARAAAGCSRAVVQKQVRQLRVGAGPARDRDAARPAPQLRHPPARRRRRSARDPGAAGPRQPVDDAGLHRGRRPPPDGALRARPPPSVTVVGTPVAVS